MKCGTFTSFVTRIAATGKVGHNGLLEAERVGRSAGGLRREFTADQAERARVIRALHRKGITLAQLARSNLKFDSGQAFVSMMATSCEPARTPGRLSQR